MKVKTIIVGGLLVLSGALVGYVGAVVERAFTPGTGLDIAAIRACAGNRIDEKGRPVDIFKSARSRPLPDIEYWLFEVKCAPVRLAV